MASPKAAVKTFTLTALDDNSLNDIVNASILTPVFASNIVHLSVLNQVRDDSIFDIFLRRPRVDGSLLVLWNVGVRQALVQYLQAHDVCVTSPEIATAKLREVVEVVVLLL